MRVFLSLFKFNEQQQQEVKQYGIRHGPNYTQLQCTRSDEVDLTAFKGQPLWAVDMKRVQVGKGKKSYEAAKKLLQRWGHFQLGWAEVSPSTKVELGAPVCVVAKTLFVWIANPLKIMYVDEETVTRPRSAGARPGKLQRYQFAQGTMRGHMLAGEERFALEWDKSDDSVWFDIYTISRPAHPFSLLTYPLTRYYQNRFKQECVSSVLQQMEQI